MDQPEIGHTWSAAEFWLNLALAGFAISGREIFSDSRQTDRSITQ